MEQLSENPNEEDFDILRRLKQKYPTKVVVASIMGTKCVGCHLCRLVCPTGAIGVSKRFDTKK